MRENTSENICGLCQRTVDTVTWHHLIPKEEGGRYSKTVPLCQPCHSTIHYLFTNKELKKLFPSLEALQQAESLQTYLNWIRNTRIERISNREKRRRR